MVVFSLKMPFIAETCCQWLFDNKFDLYFGIQLTNMLLDKFDLYLFLYLLLYFKHNGDALPIFQ